MISVIIPTYNEAGQVEQTIEKINEALKESKGVFRAFIEKIKQINGLK